MLSISSSDSSDAAVPARGFANIGIKHSTSFHRATCTLPWTRIARANAFGGVADHCISIKDGIKHNCTHANNCAASDYGRCTVIALTNCGGGPNVSKILDG